MRGIEKVVVAETEEEDVYIEPQQTKLKKLKMESLLLMSHETN